MRVVSLLPSATEILCSIGGEGLLVGRSHECDFPPSIIDRPVLTAQTTRLDPDCPSGATASIDAAVRERARAGDALYTVDALKLAELRPDLILTQDVCGVCSVGLETVRGIVADMRSGLGLAPEVLSLNPATVEDVLDDVLRVGEATGLGEAAVRKTAELRERLYRAQEFVTPYAEGPVVGFLEWTDPLFIAGHWTVQLIERAGGRHPLNETVARPDAGAAAGPQQGERVAGKSVRAPAEALAATRPEALVIAPCGLSVEQTRRAVEADLRGQGWFEGLPAVRSGRVALVDGSRMFNRPGPRLAEAFEWLVGWLNGRPELIPEGFPWEEMGE